MFYNETPRSAWTGSETIQSALSYVKHEFVDNRGDCAVSTSSAKVLYNTPSYVIQLT